MENQKELTEIEKLQMERDRRAQRIKLKNQKYYAKKKEMILQKKKDGYVEQNQIVTCEICNCELKSLYLKDHKYTKKHIENLSKLHLFQPIDPPNEE